MANLPCIQTGCTGTQQYATLGLCRSCYNKRRYAGDPAITKRPRPERPAHCSDCEKPMRKNRRCRDCWRTAVAEAARNKAPREQNGPCSITDCEKPWVSLGLCEMHYARHKRHGDAETVLRPKSYTHPTCRGCGKRAKEYGSLCQPCRAARLCVVEGCSTSEYVRGYCEKHYQRVRKHGDPHIARLRSIELVALLPKPEDDCINWPYLGNNGYGRAHIGGKNHMAYRYVWEQQVGPIPAGLELDHLCVNRACVNVKHLEPVTGAENKRRRWVRWWAAQEES